jgi:hypothetical protein
VFDDKTDSPVHTSDASATATVLAGQEKQTVTLRPGVVLIQFPGKTSIVARFSF